MPDRNTVARRIGVGVAATLAVGLPALITRWRRRRQRELAAGSTLITTNRGVIEYARVGHGPVVLICHAHGGGYDMGLTTAQIFGLQEAGFQVLSVSRPGYLRTPLDSGQTPTEQAQLFAALLDTLEIDRVAVLGYSAGGMSAIALAQHAPERVWAAISVVGVVKRIPLESAAAGDITPEWVPSGVLDGLAWGTEKVLAPLAFPQFVRMAVGPMTHHDETHTADAEVAHILSTPALRQLLPEVLRSTSPISLRRTGETNDTTVFTRQLADAPEYQAIRCPLLAYYAGRDPYVTPDHGEWLNSVVPGAELYMDPDSGHYVFTSPGWPDGRARVHTFLHQHMPG